MWEDTAGQPVNFSSSLGSVPLTAPMAFSQSQSQQMGDNQYSQYSQAPYAAAGLDLDPSNRTTARMGGAGAGGHGSASASGANATQPRRAKANPAHPLYIHQARARLMGAQVVSTLTVDVTHVIALAPRQEIVEQMRSFRSRPDYSFERYYVLPTWLDLCHEMCYPAEPRPQDIISIPSSMQPHAPVMMRDDDSEDNRDATDAEETYSQLDRL